MPLNAYQSANAVATVQPPAGLTLKSERDISEADMRRWQGLYRAFLSATQARKN
jgi:hypothetical protein